MESVSRLVKIISICALVVLCVNFAIQPVAVGAGINEKKAKKTRVMPHGCKPEKGVKFEGGEHSKLSTSELEDILTGNTLVSVDRFGTIAVYYPTNKETVGWMPKKKKEWTKGTVTFENNKYCRKWKAWSSGKKINCWEIHKGENRLDMPTLYLTCANGVPDGAQNIVFPGNYFNIEYKGSSKKSFGASFKQDSKKVKEVLKKYFRNFEKQALH